MCGIAGIYYLNEHDDGAEASRSGCLTASLRSSIG